jgi:hypothetical protein
MANRLEATPFLTGPAHDPGFGGTAPAHRLTARSAHERITAGRQGRIEAKMGHSEEQAAVARRFGTNVRRLREARGLSRDELASLTDISADAIYASRLPDGWQRSVPGSGSPAAWTQNLRS